MPITNPFKASPEQTSEKKSWAYYGKSAAVGAVAGVATVALFPALGFGTAGVAAGSYAAGTQAAIGNVAAGSWFATAQSIGATMGAATVAKGVAAGGVVGAGGSAIVNKMKNKDNNEGKK